MTAGPDPLYAVAFSPDGRHAGHRRRRRHRAVLGRGLPGRAAGRRLRHRGPIPHPPAVGWLRWDPAVPAGLPGELAPRSGTSRDAGQAHDREWWSGRRSPGREAGTRAPGAPGVQAAPSAHPGRARDAGRLRRHRRGHRGGPGRDGFREPGRHERRRGPRDQRSVRRRTAERDFAGAGAVPADAVRASAILVGAFPAGDARGRGGSPGSVRARPRRRTCRAGPAPSWPPSTICAPAAPGTWARARRRPRRASSSSTCSRPCWPNARQGDGTGLSASDRTLAEQMIEDSDNDAATSLWYAVGGAARIRSFNARAGLTHTAPSSCVVCPGFAWPGWGLTTTTPDDQIALLRQLVTPSSVLPRAAREYALSLMEDVTPSQRWGVSGGVPAQVTVALKNGWLPLHGTGSDWQINSVGWISGGGRNYLMAVLSTGNPSEQYGIDTIDALAATVWQRMG